MKVLIIYDSIFGNTEKIAQAMADSLKTETVKIVQVSDVKPEFFYNLELLLVGSPTRAFKPTPSITRFINEIPLGGITGVKVAAFDTRISTVDANSRLLNGLVKVFGYAAQPIADNLLKKGGILAIQPEGFYVKDSEGPLKDGELERAGDWARRLVE